MSALPSSLPGYILERVIIFLGVVSTCDLATGGECPGQQLS